MFKILGTLRLKLHAFCNVHITATLFFSGCGGIGAPNYGRGCGVGRGLGVGVGLGVSVGA